MLRCSGKCRLFACLGAIVLLAGGTSAWWFVRNQEAQAKTPLGRSWPASKRVSIDRIDHSALDALLKKYVDDDGYVDYKSWKASAADRRKLQAYLAQLGKADLSRRSNRSTQLAFWINAYNAVTLEGILQVYPTTSIRKHTSRFGGYNIWKHLPLTVGGRKFSLDDIEHKMLRKMSEPRIHFAIVCASIGCPKLRNEAYTAKALEKQLTDNAVDFFSRPKHIRVDRRTGALYLSNILKWFGKDFGRSDGAMLKAVSPYMPRDAQRMIAAGGVRVKFALTYNWELNDQAHKPRGARP